MRYKKINEMYLKAKRDDPNKSAEELKREVLAAMGEKDFSPEAVEEALSEGLGLEKNTLLVGEGERAGRKEISENMRANHLEFCAENRGFVEKYPCDLAQEWRQFGLLFESGDSAQAQEKNAEIYAVLTGQPKNEEAIRDLVFNRLMELGRKYTIEQLDAMSDRELAENAADIRRFLSAAGEIETFVDSGGNGVSLTDEQRQQLDQLRQEQRFVAALRVGSRMELIANPYYEEIDTGALKDYPLTKVVDMAQEVGEAETVDQELIDTIQAHKLDVCADWSRSIVDAMKKNGIDVGKGGKNLKSVKLSSGEATSLDTANDLGNALSDGKYALVTMSDGKEISVFPGVKQGETRYGTAADFLNKRETSNLTRLFGRLESSDPWYLISSSQFRKMKAGLDDLNRNYEMLRDPLDREQLVAMRGKFSQLLEKSNAYLQAKMEQRGAESVDKLRGKNDRENKRIRAAKALSKFLDERVKELDERIEPEKIRTEEKTAVKAAPKAKNEISGESIQAASNNLDAYKERAMADKEMYVDSPKYVEFCDKVIEDLGKMQEICEGSGRSSGFPKYMQTLTLFNMVQMERATNQKPGVIENEIMEKGYTQVVEGMRSSLNTAIMKATGAGFTRDKAVEILAGKKERTVAMSVLGVDKDPLQKQDAPDKSVKLEHEKSSPQNSGKVMGGN